MDIRIKATEYQITSEVSAYLNERIAHVEKILADDAGLARCEVEVGRDSGHSRHGKNMWFAEMSVISPGCPRIYARNNAENVNVAIDDVKEEVVRQLRRERKLHIRMYRKGGAMLKRLMRRG